MGENNFSSGTGIATIISGYEMKNSVDEFEFD